MNLANTHIPIIDSHCHLSLIEKQYPQLHQDLKELEKKELYLLDIGLVPDDIQQRRSKYENYTHVFFSVGLHPNYCENYTPTQVETLLHTYIPKAHAIGECGLDWFHLKADKETQKKIFRIHLQMAKEYQKPLIIHSRDSLTDIIIEIEKFYDTTPINIHGPMGVIHCFSGTIEQAQQCLALGFYISFTANISYKKNIHLQEIVKTIPDDSLLLETDAPYLSHQSIRGTMNHPKNMPLLYQTVVALKDCTLDTLTKNIKHNLLRLLDL